MSRQKHLSIFSSQDKRKMYRLRGGRRTSGYCMISPVETRALPPEKERREQEAGKYFLSKIFLEKDKRLLKNLFQKKKEPFAKKVHSVQL